MGFEYDFDIVAIAPDEVDPEHGVAALTGNRAVRALFRDFHAAQALRTASPKIRRIFLESGFSLETRNSGLPHGRYSPEDALDRERVLRRLFSNIRNMGVQGEYFGDFDIWRFLEQVRAARPVSRNDRVKSLQPLEPQQTDAPEQNGASRQERKPVPRRLGYAFGLAILLFAVLKYLADQGAPQ